MNAATRAARFSVAFASLEKASRTNGARASVATEKRRLKQSKRAASDVRKDSEGPRSIRTNAHAAQQKKPKTQAGNATGALGWLRVTQKWLSPTDSTQLADSNCGGTWNGLTCDNHAVRTPANANSCFDVLCLFGRSNSGTRWQHSGNPFHLQNLLRANLASANERATSGRFQHARQKPIRNEGPQVTVNMHSETAAFDAPKTHDSGAKGSDR